MDESKFPPKASTNNVEKKEFNKIIIVIDKILALRKKIFFSHKSQVVINRRSTEANFTRWPKHLTRRSGVGWGR